MKPKIVEGIPLYPCPKRNQKALVSDEFCQKRAELAAEVLPSLSRRGKSYIHEADLVDCWECPRGGNGKVIVRRIRSSRLGTHYTPLRPTPGPLAA